MGKIRKYFCVLVAVVFWQECLSKEYYMVVTWGRMKPGISKREKNGEFTNASCPKPQERGIGKEFTSKILCTVEKPVSAGVSFIYIRKEYEEYIGNDNATQRIIFQAMRNDMRREYSIDDFANYFDLPDTITEVSRETVEEYSNLNLLQEYKVIYTHGPQALHNAEFPKTADNEDNRDCLKIPVIISRKLKNRPQEAVSQIRDPNIQATEVEAEMSKLFYMNVIWKLELQLNSLTAETNDQNSSSSPKSKPEDVDKGKLSTARILCSLEKSADEDGPCTL